MLAAVKKSFPVICHVSSFFLSVKEKGRKVVVFFFFSNMKEPKMEVKNLCSVRVPLICQ